MKTKLFFVAVLVAQIPFAVKVSAQCFAICELSRPFAIDDEVKNISNGEVLIEGKNEAQISSKCDAYGAKKFSAKGMDSADLAAIKKERGGVEGIGSIETVFCENSPIYKALLSKGLNQITKELSACRNHPGATIQSSQSSIKSARPTESSVENLELQDSKATMAR